VNGDGKLDLLLHFRTQDTNLRSIYKELLAAADATINGILDPGVSTHQQFRVTLTGKMLTVNRSSGRTPSTCSYPVASCSNSFASWQLMD
jgi:hypothetical protein